MREQRLCNAIAHCIAVGDRLLPVVDRAVADHGVEPGQLVLGTDNGTPTRVGAFALV